LALQIHSLAALSLLSLIVGAGCDRTPKPATVPSTSAATTPATGPAATAPTPSPAAAGARVKTLWEEGRQDAAADLLVGTDWPASPSDAQATLSASTEQEFIALPPSKREERQYEIIRRGAQMKDLARFVVARGRTLASDGDRDAAERDFEGLYRYGRAVTGDERTAAIARLFGVAFQRTALNELVNLHQAGGDAAKLAEARQRLSELK
jgi:hypothetical protein